MKTRNGKRGGSTVEFALLTPMWLPMLLGTLAIGSTMGRGLQAIHVARDATRMYALGVDFSQSGNQTMLGLMAGDVGTLTSTGTGVVIFSTLLPISRNVCQTAGYADLSTPPVPTSACKNYGHFAFTQRLVIGNTSLQSSAIGSPGTVPDSSGNISLDDSVTKTSNKADTFTRLPYPGDTGTDQPVYMVEVYFKGTSFAGFTQGGSYTYAIF